MSAFIIWKINAVFSAKKDFTSCVTDERNLYLIDFLQLVFSDKVSVKRFEFECSKPEEVLTSWFFQLSLTSDCDIKELSLVNSNFLIYTLQTIIDHSPELEIVDSQGIQVPEIINFSGLPELKKIKN